MSDDLGELGELSDADPRRVGPYELLGVLGAGGMGRVYLGRTAAGDQAAVKVIHGDLARDPEFRKRFAREAVSTRDLSAPGIARLVAADPEAERPWLATEYVDGPSLHEVVTERGVLDQGAVRALGAGLAEALATVHAAGLVHRDVKPPNVLMSGTGPKLIDFGIARDSAASTITRTGIAIGTPQFMAPEQLQAQRDVGAAADVFALAGLLVFAATGRSPFGEGSPAQLLYAVVHTEPRLDEVPAGLRPLLARCLAKDPAVRPSAPEVAGELSGELQTHQHVVTDPARAVSPGGEIDAATAAETSKQHRDDVRTPFFASASAAPAGEGLRTGPAASEAPTDEALPSEPGADVAGHGDPAATATGQRRRRLLVAAAGLAAVLAIAATLAEGHASGSDSPNAARPGSLSPASGGTVGGLPSTPSGATGGPGTAPSSGTATGTSPGSVVSGSAASGSASATATTPLGHPATTVGPGPTSVPSAKGSTHPVVLPVPVTTTTGVTAPSSSPAAMCGSVPCRSTQSPTVQIIHSNDANTALCLDVGQDIGNGKPAAAVSQTCSGTAVGWRILRGTTPGTVQFETLQTPGQCITSVGANNAPDLAACSPSEPNQWFYADTTGGTAQVKSFGGTIGCMNVGWAFNVPYVQIGGCSTGNGNLWRLGS